MCDESPSVSSVCKLTPSKKFATTTNPEKQSREEITYALVNSTFCLFMNHESTIEGITFRNPGTQTRQMKDSKFHEINEGLNDSIYSIYPKKVYLCIRIRNMTSRST